MRLLALILLIPSTAICGGLRHIIKTDSNIVIPAGYVCYSPKGQDMVDLALKKALKNKKELDKCLSEASLKSEVVPLSPIVIKQEPLKAPGNRTKSALFLVLMSVTMGGIMGSVL